MKEIDFDELDRAVSSLMNGVPKSEPVKNDDVKTISLSSDAVPADNQSSAPSAPVAPSTSITVADASDEPAEREAPSIDSGTSSQVPLASPAARRGRYMDMVRSPGREEKRPAFSMGVSRHGTTLQPTSAMRPAAVDNFLRSSSASQSASAADTQEEAAAQAEPFNAAKHEAVPQLQEAREEVEITAEPANEQASSVSPFLPDAKVEKRPLGRPGAASGATQLFRGLSPSLRSAPEPLPEPNENERSDPISHDKDAQLPEQPLPAELDSELLHIETRTEAVASAGQSPAAPDTPSASASTASSLAASSIPQQYKVQPKTDQEPSGTIYDTTSYHQPLAHPAKKKPDWLLVVAIIAILLIGIAGAAAAYFFRLI